ncbi:MAG: tetratricopeptide repeat protein [Desulfobulbaceae bacterium]|nr:tetratricopeptide repeat protein [Desulfobulbaceae bacterium]
MSKEEAVFFHRQGLKMLHGGQLNEAIEFFSKAVELNPNFTDAYQNRGEVLKMQERFVEANLDLQTAKDLRAGRVKGTKSVHKQVAKLNMAEIENIYDAVYPDGTEYEEEDTIHFKDDLFDYVFSDDTLETDSVWSGLTQKQDKTAGVPVILEYLGGKREEVLSAILFHPLAHEISIIAEDGNVDRVVALDCVCCIRLSGLPEEFQRFQDCICHIEIIETNDGNIFHEAIPPEQDLENGLFGFSTKEQTRFKYSFFPRINIKKRCQQRYLGDILLEKRFIAGNVLKKALEEFQHLKELKLGRIIAQKAKLDYSAVEMEIQKAREGPLKGLKIGEILLAAGMVNENQVLEALNYQESIQNKKIGQFLVEKGVLQESEVYISLAEKFRIPFIDLRKIKVNRKILSLLPRDVVLKHNVMPIALKGSALIIATLEPDPSAICEDILKYSRIPDIQFVLAQPSHLKNVINLLYKTKEYLE